MQPAPIKLSSSQRLPTADPIGDGSVTRTKSACIPWYTAKKKRSFGNHKNSNQVTGLLYIQEQHLIKMEK